MLSSILHGTDNLPGVVQIARGGWELLGNGTLLRYTVASLFRVTVGFYLAALVAIPLGICLGRHRRLSQWANPFIQFLRPVSPLAWIPFAMIWFGIGDRPALFIIFMASFFPILLTTISAAAMIPNMYFQVAANLQFRPLESLCYVILPATLPSIVLALRVALGIAWLVVVAAEMIAVKSGLGFLIVDARNALRIDHVVVAIMVIGAIGLVLDHIMTRLERIGSVRWRFEQA